jgi:methionyl-tRNA formyltransferase
MVMNDKLDQGPIVDQVKFAVEPNWTQTEYYQHSFDLICQIFPQKMVDLAEKKISPLDQPEESPTPVAQKLTKADSFIDWLELNKALNSSSYLAPQLEQATRAYSPWPGLWTIIPTAKGDKRMKILKTHLDQNHLVLDQVQIEGLQPTTWNEVKNLVTRA